MSKRKNRKNSAPNLPQETLERARRDAGLEPETIIDDEVEAAEAELEIEEEIVTMAPPRQRPAEKAATPRRSLPAAQQSRRRRKEVAYSEMSQAEVIYLLEHPTKEVGEDVLRAQYGYVLADLRNMGLLALGLFVALIVIAGVFIVG